MTLKMLVFAAAAGLALAAGTAQAREVYDDVFFVRAHASAGDLFQDRAACRTAATHMSDADAFYSNPEYGALSAMGSALDEDALHDGGLHKRMERVVFDHCMRAKGWADAAPTGQELKALQRADAHHPQALDAWLKSHEPAPEATPETTPAVSAGDVVKTSASGAK